MRPAALAACALLSSLFLAPPPARADIDVTIDGLDGPLRENAELRMSIRAQGRRADLDQGLAEALYRDGFQDIRKALQPFGYYNPVMTGTLEGQAPDWTAHYRIDAGPRTHIETVDVQVDGEGAEALEPVRAAILRQIKPGDALVHADYERAKDRLASAAYAGGFLDARFSRAELRVIADDNLAQIHLSFDTGTRYRFGAVTIEQDVLDGQMLERYVPIQPGRIYDPQALLDTQFALSDLGYFETLEILPQRDAAEDGQVPILIRTTPQPRTLYNFGVGYGTDTGARLSAGAQVRRVNRDGHTAKVETRLSQIKNTARAEYRIPLGKSFTFTAGPEANVFVVGTDLPDRTVIWQGLFLVGMRVGL